MVGKMLLLDEKHIAHNLFEPATDSLTRYRNPQRHYILTQLVPAVLILLALYSIFRTTFVCHHHYDHNLSWRPLDAVEDGGAKQKVGLEIHVMSKCPDARDCLHELIVPTMVQVSEKVNLTMSFIGRYRNSHYFNKSF